MLEQGRLVMPGEELAVEEEFSPGDGTFCSNGVVRAAQAGKVFYDMINRRVNVIPFKRSGLMAMRTARIVIGVVVGMRDDVAFVEVFSVDDKEVGSRIDAVLPSSQVVERAGEPLTNYIRLGDLIRARPVNKSVPLVLTLKQKDLGVIYATCSNCGAVLLRQDNDHLRCQRCGQVERRKIGAYMVRRVGGQGS